MRQHLISAAILLFASVVPASAPQSGDIVVFLVPHLTPIALGAQGDIVVFSGTPAGTIDPTGCSNNTGDTAPRFLQSGLLVQPGSGGKPFRLDGSIIVLYTNDAPQVTPVASGTRFWNMFQPGPCNIGDVIYDRYVGFVK